jgi:hypothetical protein
VEVERQVEYPQVGRCGLKNRWMLYAFNDAYPIDSWPLVDKNDRSKADDTVVEFEKLQLRLARDTCASKLNMHWMLWGGNLPREALEGYLNEHMGISSRDETN